jgi:phospholipase A1/A2
MSFLPVWGMGQNFRLIFSLGMLLVGLPLRAVVFNLVAPPEPLAVGGSVSLNLLILNPGKLETVLSVDESLNGELSDGATKWPVQLHAPAMGGPMAIAAGGFAVREFSMELPAQAQGRLVLEITKPVLARVSLEVNSSISRTASVKAPLTNFAPQHTAEVAFKRAFAGRFSAHEASYFVYGDADQAAKFQFSFKYRLLGERAELGEKVPALRSLYFAYTQRSLWELNEDSSPFYDTTYQPELMFESQSVLDPESSGGMKWIGYQVGLRHESNGQSGPTSRSINTVYFRPGLAFGRLDGWNLVLAPRLSLRVSDLSNNPDIEDYRGNIELLAVAGRNDGVALSLLTRLGRDGNKGSMQLDLTYPVKFDRMFDFATYVLFQYWNGYGESLRDYDVDSTAYRFGFSLVR